MTVPATYSRAGPFSGTGVIVPLPFDFKVFAQEDVRVTRTDVDGFESTLVVGVDYTVTLNPDQDADPGGVVVPVVAPAVGELTTLTSGLEYEQPIDLVTGGKFRAQTVEDGLDRTTMLIKQLKEQSDRTLQLPISAVADATLPAPSANDLIGWNSDATALQNVDPTTLATIVAFGTTNADLFSGDDAQTVFLLTANPGAQANLDVAIDGVTQRPGIDYTWSGGTTLTFAVAPPVGTDNILARYQQGLPTGHNPDLADTTDPSKGDALVGVKQPFAGAQATTQHSKNAESVSLLDFIPASEHAAIRNYTSITDLTVYIHAAFAACNGREIVVPSGLYNHAALQVPKASKLALRGEFAGYSSTEGAIFNYTGAGVGLQFGVDDGNPDITGPAVGGKLQNLHLKTSTGATAVRVQNTALFEMTHCTVRLFSGKVIDLRANVITRILNNDIAGSLPASGNYGIWCDDQYFGNFVVDILDNHIFQVNHAGRFSGGRSLTVHNNTVENIRPGAAGGVWKFETAGYISVASFKDNYYENHRGYVYEGASFTGAILYLILNGEDAWGSGDPGNVNPGVGNLPKTKVAAHDIRGNFYVDSSWNAQMALVMPSVYPTTSVFDTTTTKILSQVTNREYEDDIVYSLQGNDLMKVAGDFSGITAGTPGTLVVGGSTQPSNNGAAASGPFGWTQVIAGAVWNAIVDAITGAWVCYTPASGGTFNLATYTQTLTPIAATRYFAVCFTSKGWAALRLNGNIIYDSGASITTYHTEVVKFTVPASTASFTFTLGTNAAPSYWAEMRLFEVGAAEYNEPGALGGALTKAIKRLMRRGAY